VPFGRRVNRQPEIARPVVARVWRDLVARKQQGHEIGHRAPGGEAALAVVEPDLGQHTLEDHLLDQHLCACGLVGVRGGGGGERLSPSEELVQKAPARRRRRGFEDTPHAVDDLVRVEPLRSQRKIEPLRETSRIPQLRPGKSGLLGDEGPRQSVDRIQCAGHVERRPAPDGGRRIFRPTFPHVTLSSRERRRA